MSITLTSYLEFFITISVALAFHDYETRSKTNKNLFLLRVNFNYGQFCVKYAAIKTWNETPNEIRASKSTKVLGKNTKTSS